MTQQEASCLPAHPWRACAKRTPGETTFTVARWHWQPWASSRRQQRALCVTARHIQVHVSLKARLSLSGFITLRTHRVVHHGSVGLTALHPVASHVPGDVFSSFALATVRALTVCQATRYACGRHACCGAAHSAQSVPPQPLARARTRTLPFSSAGTKRGHLPPWEACKACAFSTCLNAITQNLGQRSCHLRGQHINEWILQQLTLHGAD